MLLLPSMGQFLSTITPMRGVICGTLGFIISTMLLRQGILICFIFRKSSIFWQKYTISTKNNILFYCGQEGCYFLDEGLIFKSKDKQGCSTRLKPSGENWIKNRYERCPVFSISTVDHTTFEIGISCC